MTIEELNEEIQSLDVRSQEYAAQNAQTIEKMKELEQLALSTKASYQHVLAQKQALEEIKTKYFSTPQSDGSLPADPISEGA